MVLLGELDELVLAHIVTKPKPLLAHARADLDSITPAVVILYEEENLVFGRRSPSLLPIPPRHAEPTVGPESVEPLQSTSPSSYFTAAENQSQRSSSVASTSVAGTEGALSETETVKVAQVGRDEIFGTSIEAWRGLHLVCRRLEA